MPPIDSRWQDCGPWPRCPGKEGHTAAGRCSKSLISRAIGEQVRFLRGRRIVAGHVEDVTARSRHGRRRSSTAAITQQLAGRAIDEMQARAGRTGHRLMRAASRLVAEPMLHVHASLRAFEDNLVVHGQDMTARRAFWNYGCLRRSAVTPPHGRLRNSTQFGFLPVG